MFETCVSLNYSRRVLLISYINLLLEVLDKTIFNNYRVKSDIVALLSTTTRYPVLIINIDLFNGERDIIQTELVRQRLVDIVRVLTSAARAWVARNGFKISSTSGKKKVDTIGSIK